MTKVLVIGDIYLEKQFIVDDIPLQNQFSFAGKFFERAGSKTLNSGRVFSKLGDNVGFYAKIGNDKDGVNLANYLGKYKVKSLLQAEDSSSGQITVTTNNAGDSSVVLYPGANIIFGEKDLGLIDAELSRFDFVYTGTNHAPEILYKIIKLVERRSIPIFIDFSNNHKSINLKDLSNVDWVMPNRHESGLILDRKIESIKDAKQAIRDLRVRLKGNILITLDKDGCLVLERDKSTPVHYKTTKVKQVDATGSGDIFRAVFAHELFKTKNIESSIQSALDLSTQSVEIAGFDQKINKLF